MDYEIVWTDRASTDLQAILEYIAEHNVEAARQLADSLVERIDLLRTVPLMGAAYPRSGSTAECRTITFKKYRVFYRILDRVHRVEILTVWHGARADPSVD